MRDFVTTAADLVGLGLLTLAAFLVAVWFGFAVAGASVLYASWKLA